MTSQSPNIPAYFLTRVVQATRYVISGITPSTWFSPLQPLPPMAPPEVKGRMFDYQVGLNTRYQPRSTEPVGFAKLQLLAENCGILRSVIERQKDLVESFEWTIKPREETPGKRPAESKYKPEITAITTLLKSPDHDLDWGQWIRAVLEDLFVLDAVSIYRRPTLDGKGLWGLERLDGSTVVPLINADGRTPQSPSPAYQQRIKGIPASDYTREELIYYPRSPRNNRLYGTPPVQWIIGYVEAYIQRQRSQTAFFTEGNLTDGMFSGPAEWSIDQIKTWQSYWDDQFLGNVETRRHGMWVPNGTTFEAIKPPPLKDDFDEWLARIVCFAFSTSPQPFIKQVSRGNQESQQQVAEDGGIASTLQFIKKLMDKVIAEDFDRPELEFSWSTDKEFDPLVQAQINDIGLKNGSKVLNEVRDANGDDPYPPELGDVPLVITATGGVSVESIIAPPPPPAPPNPSPGAAPGDEGAPSGGAGVRSAGGAVPPKAAPKVPEPAKPLKKAETPAPGVDTPEMAKARTATRKAVHKVFQRMAADVGAQAHRKALMMGKADNDPDPEKDAAAIAASLDLSGLDDIAEGVEDTFAGVAETAGNLTMVQVGLEEDDKLTNQVAQRALTWARTRAAELVGKRWTADGELIDNPNAKWAIDDSTRTMLRDTIAQALEDNQSVPQLADLIKASYAFSEERAEVIAHTEVARANVQGALAGAREAQDAGVVLQKVWLLGQSPCDECLDNADAGAIDIDEGFPSGDDGPPAHPNACFEGTTFAPYGSVSQMLRSRYDGPAVTIEAEFAQERAQASLRNVGALSDLNDGNILGEKASDKGDLLLRDRPVARDLVQITIGPNHPMLSRRGWIKASEVHEGDELLYDAAPIDALVGSASEPDLKEVMCFEDAFSALRADSDTVHVTASADYFHGDEVFCYGEIETVRPARDLLPKLDASGLEHLGECSLVGAYPDAEHVAACGVCQLRLDGVFAAANGVVRRRDDGGALLGGAGCPPSLHLVRVVSRHLGTFQGWAFDASTEHTIYRAGGFVVKNCYCSLSWEVDLDASKADGVRQRFMCEAA